MGKLKKIKYILESLYNDLRLNNMIQVSQSTLRRWILKCGFKFKLINKRASIMENRRIVEWRLDYLESIKKFRQENRPIYY